MALKGSIKEFGLTEIFQLIYHQHKEGVLSMTREKERVVVLFKAGKIIRAYEGDHKEVLLKKLNKASFLTNDQAGIIRYRVANSNKSIESLIIELAFIAESEMMRLSRLFTEECLFGLFLWDSGEYQFEQQKVAYNAKLITPLETQLLLMEGVRQIDEWPALLKKIPSRETLFMDISDEHPVGKNTEEEKKKNNPDDPFADFSEPGNTENESNLWLLEQVGEGKTVQQMIDQARMGHFSVYQGLARLLKEKKIETITEDEKSGNKQSRPLERKTVITGLVTAIIIVITLGLFLVSLPTMQSVLVQAFVPFQEIKNFSKKNEVYFIRYMLDLYYLKHHHYPDKLQNLFNENLFGASENISFNQREITDEWFYQRTNENGQHFHLNRK